MGSCGRCCAVLGFGVAVVVAIALYPLLAWDTAIPMRTRLFAVFFDHINPGPSFNLPSLVGVLSGRTPVEASRLLGAAVGARASLDSVHAEDLQVSGVPVRLYRPAAIGREEVLPVLIFFHGGGYVTGDVESHHALCLMLCHQAAQAVVSVDYRLAPEHLYPAAFEDSLAVTKEIAGNADVSAALGVDPASVSVGGDSAGGALTAAVSLYMARTKLPPLRSQVSIYPTLRYVHTDLDKLTAYSAPGGLSTKQMYFFRSIYLGGAAGPEELALDLGTKSPKLLPPDVWAAALERVLGNVDVPLSVPSVEQYPYANAFLNDSLVPLMAKTLRGTPPTILLVAGIDPLRDDGELYEQRLRREGIEVDMNIFERQVHGFMNFAPCDLKILGWSIPILGDPDALDAIQRAANFVRRHNRPNDA